MLDRIHSSKYNNKTTNRTKPEKTRSEQLHGQTKNKQHQNFRLRTVGCKIAKKGVWVGGGGG